MYSSRTCSVVFCAFGELATVYYRIFFILSSSTWYPSLPYLLWLRFLRNCTCVVQKISVHVFQNCTMWIPTTPHVKWVVLLWFEHVPFCQILHTEVCMEYKLVAKVSVISRLTEVSREAKKAQSACPTKKTQPLLWVIYMTEWFCNFQKYYVIF